MNVTIFILTTILLTVHSCSSPDIEPASIISFNPCNNPTKKVMVASVYRQSNGASGNLNQVSSMW